MADDFFSRMGKKNQKVKENLADEADHEKKEQEQVRENLRKAEPIVLRFRDGLLKQGIISQAPVNPNDFTLWYRIPYQDGSYSELRLKVDKKEIMGYRAVQYLLEERYAGGEPWISKDDQPESPDITGELFEVYFERYLQQVIELFIDHGGAHGGLKES